MQPRKLPPLEMPVITRRDGHPVALDACGLPTTADELTTTIHLLEGRQAVEAPEYRWLWANAIAWRRCVLAALEAAEMPDER